MIEYVIGRNRRIGNKVNGALVQGFLYRGQLQPVAELDGAGNVVSRFVYATRVNVPDYIVKPATGAVWRVVTDHLGSVRLVVDDATGAVVQRIDYDEFGRVVADTNPGAQPFGFAGGLLDVDTGLTRFGARDYSPVEGRWTTKDPIRFRGGVNLYRYAANDPVNLVDRNGLWVQIIDNSSGDMLAAYNILRTDSVYGPMLQATEDLPADCSSFAAPAAEAHALGRASEGSQAV